MAISNFIPQIWSARLQEKLQHALVFGTLCNRSYEGDIRQWGDTVHINTINDITVKPYDPAVAIDDPEELSGADTTLVIDHGAYYNFFINDVDAVQARADLMDAAMKNAAERLARDAESYILSVIRAGAGKKETKAIPDGGLYALLVDIKTAMDKAGCPAPIASWCCPPSWRATCCWTSASSPAPLLRRAAWLRAPWPAQPASTCISAATCRARSSP